MKTGTHTISLDTEDKRRADFLKESVEGMIEMQKKATKVKGSQPIANYNTPVLPSFSKPEPLG